MAKRKEPATKPAASEAPATAYIEPGKPAPSFKLNNQTGQSKQLKDFKGSWLVLYFYPKDDTPGCTTEACSFRDGSKAFAEREAVVVGVSPDDEKSHTKFVTKHKLPFDLLADTEQVMCRAYGVWQQKSMYGKTYMGVARTTYLIDPAGKIAHRWDKVKVDGHDQDVMAKIDELKK